MKPRPVLTALPIVFFALALFTPDPARLYAATFNVSTVSELRTALAAAQQNGQLDTINIAAGTYDVSDEGLAYKGSNAPAENLALTIVGAGAGQTILDGGNLVRVLLISNSAVADAAAHVTIRGVTVQRGGILNHGGGLLIETNAASITVEDSEFLSSEAEGSGGGLFINSHTGSIVLSGIVASGNTNGQSGAGAYIQTGSGGPANITIRRSVFTDNISGAVGGGLAAFVGAPGKLTVAGSTFSGNEALATDSSAGGAYLSTTLPGEVIFVNNTLHGNRGHRGGGVHFYGGGSTVLNNTVSGNHATMDGGGMYFEMQGGGAPAAATISNNIVWDNTTGGVGGDFSIVGGSSTIATLTFNNYEDLAKVGDVAVLEENNISAEPLFLAAEDSNPSNWDLHLDEGSPAIDAGSNPLLPSATTAIPAGDRDGDSRVVDGDANGTATVDMGSDEFIPQPSVSVLSASLDFGTTQGEKALTITNTGTVLAIGAIAGANPLAPPFSVTADTCSNRVLSRMQSCSVTVTFDASTASAASGIGGSHALWAGVGFLALGAFAAKGRRRALIAFVLLLAVASGGALASCSSGGGGGGGDDRTSYTDSFDVPTNDPAKPSLTISVSGSA